MSGELDKLVVLEEFFAQKLWFLELGDGRRVSGASIKIEASGYLLIIKARSAEGPQVAFVGAGSLTGIRSKLLLAENGSSLKWRADQYALDRLGEI